MLLEPPFQTKPRKAYPRQTLEVRLQHWLHRIHRRNPRMIFPRTFEIRLKLTQELLLPNSIVELRADGTLWHSSRSAPIATFHHSK